MENSPLDLSKPETPNPLRSCKACARECRRARHRARASIRYSSDEPDPAACKRAGRSEQRRMGHRIRMTRRKPTQRPTGSSGACRPAASRGRVMRGTLRTPRCGRRARAPAVHRNGGCPARDIAAWRAFYPGRGERPRNRAERRTGENGNGDRRLGRRDNGGDGGDGGDSVAMRVVRVGRRHQRHPPPVGRPRTGAGMAARYRLTGRSLRTLASSRSDRRPDARHRK